MSKFFDDKLLVGLGIGSFIMATLSAIRYSPMAKEAITNKKEELGVDKLTPIDTVKVAGKYFVAPAAFSVIGTVCVVAGNQTTANREAAAIASCALCETAFSDYRAKTKELVGEKKEQDIREAAAKTVVDRAACRSNEIIETGRGDFLCYDDAANQFFRSKKTIIQSTINDLNEMMMTSMTNVTLNDYCLALGLKEVLLGEDLGWSITTTGLIRPDIIVQERCQEPCYVITHACREPKSF